MAKWPMHPYRAPARAKFIYHLYHITAAYATMHYKNYCLTAGIKSTFTSFDYFTSLFIFIVYYCIYDLYDTFDDTFCRFIPIFTVWTSVRGVLK